MAYSSTASSPIFPEKTMLQTPDSLQDLIDEASSDSDDDAEQVLFHFKIANPDTNRGESTNSICKSSTVDKNSTGSTMLILQTGSTITESGASQAKHLDRQELTVNSVNDGAKNTRHSFTSMQLTRRQSKTLDSDMLSTKHHHRNTIHTIQEVTEYQQHLSSASVFEPLVTATKKKLQIRSESTSPPEPLPLNAIPPAQVKPPSPPLPARIYQNHNASNSAHRVHTIPSSNNSMSSRSANYDKTMTMNEIKGFGKQQRDYQDDISINSTTDINTPSALSPTFSNRVVTTPTTPGCSTGSRNHLSKYNHASYTLTNHPDALKLYRQMAEKTHDEMVQLSYAKYLFEVAALYQPQSQQQQHAVTGEITAETKKKTALEEEGVRWIRRLSKQGVGEAAFLQARWMETQQYGFKMPKQTYKIDRHYHVAAQAGVPEASYRLAVRQEAADHSPIQDTFRLYQKAADLKCVQAIYKMAKIYLHGELGQHQHLIKGMNYLLSAVNLATTDCHEPPYLLALILINKYSKLSVPSEVLEMYGGTAHVVKYMEQAANLGNIGAKNRTAHIYEHGLYGVHINMDKAFRYYQDAANNGQHLQSMLGLSRLHNGGCHGPNDNDEHLRFANDVSGWLVSTPKDEDQSFYWCQRAAKGGLSDGLYLLGWYYEIGWGTPRNGLYSQECYQRAAEKGQLEARAQLTNQHSFTRYQDADTFGNRENRKQFCGNLDSRSSISGNRTSDDCIVM